MDGPQETMDSQKVCINVHAHLFFSGQGVFQEFARFSEGYMIPHSQKSFKKIPENPHIGNKVTILGNVLF